MITNSERRFIEQWCDQKKGPKWQYYLIFTIAWATVSFLVIFFLLKLFTNLWATGGPNFIYLLIAIALVIGALSAHLTYFTNEKKYHRIMSREKQDHIELKN
jgi:uncharacterized membrane protein